MSRNAFSNACAHPIQHRTKLARNILLTASLLLAIGNLMMTNLPQTALAGSGNPGFDKWVKQFWYTAKKNGIRRSTYNRAFANVSLDTSIYKANRNQAEFVRPIWDYMFSAVSDTRVERGQEILKKHWYLLDRIEKRYGVQKQILLAIWGMESNYGRNQGSKNVIQSLATLAYKGRRKRFGRQQLIGALKILQRGDITPEKMTGSWAGAMGHTQFIPTTYNAYAVDFDGDGKRDIWNNVADALASTANYLRRSRWKYTQTWGYEVVLPSRFNTAYAGRKGKRTRSVGRWKAMGILRVKGRDFPRNSDKAHLLLPAGKKGPAFLVINNFRSILRYNQANAYALGVGHLADQIMGHGNFITSWPTNERPLSKEERFELQKRLVKLGYQMDKIDGILGTQTRRAVRAYQKRLGHKTDGYPGIKILKTLRKDPRSRAQVTRNWQPGIFQAQ